MQFHLRKLFVDLIYLPVRETDEVKQNIAICAYNFPSLTCIKKVEINSRSKLMRFTRI